MLTLARPWSRLHATEAQLRSLDAYLDHDSHAEAANALGISLRTHHKHLEMLREANRNMPTHRLVAIRAQELGVRKPVKDEPDPDGLWAA